MPRRINESLMPCPELLRLLFVGQGLMSKEVAAILDRTTGQIEKQLKRHKITKGIRTHNTYPKSTTVLANNAERVSQSFLSRSF